MATPERRADSNGGAPTALIQSYERMSSKKRAMLFKVGLGLLIFTVGLPLVAGVWIDLPNVYWFFAFGGGITGLAMMWPEAAIFVFQGFAKLIPAAALKGLLSKPERRAREAVEEVLEGDDEDA